MSTGKKFTNTSGVDTQQVFHCRTTGVAEKVTQQEQAEEMAFLNVVTATPPMQYVHQYLARKVGSLGP